MGMSCLFFAGEGLSQRDTGGESLPCGYSGWKCGLEGVIAWVHILDLLLISHGNQHGFFNL